jgi:hypothetical protein
MQKEQTGSASYPLSAPARGIRAWKSAHEEQNAYPGDLRGHRFVDPLYYTRTAMITALLTVEQEIELLIALPASRVVRAILWRWMAQEWHSVHDGEAYNKGRPCADKGVLVMIIDVARQLEAWTCLFISSLVHTTGTQKYLSLNWFF